MSEIDLYLQLQKNLIRGRNIQTMEFRSYIDKEEEEHGYIDITYLCGERITVPMDPVMTPDERQDILLKVCALQDIGCYPQAENNCDLGITKLS